jgi:alkanesulfonate monooxygenase SsuD/methylene tetrahydromethanopterin reductase-like flavin-dependent oxidoreductase (luciferase family)
MDRVRFGCQLISSDPIETLELGRLADEQGFDVISVPDHLFHPLEGHFLAEPPFEAWTMLGALAIKTKNAMLMPAVSDAVRRHPAILAHMVATLDRLSRGRAALGLGSGEAFNIIPLLDLDWSKPVTRLREALIVIRELFKSTKEQPANFKGRFFNLSNAHLSLKPIQSPHPPIYVGAWGSRSRRIAGELGDGWLPWMQSPRTYRNALRDLEEGAKKSGRRIEDLVKGVMTYTVILSDGDEAKRAVEPRTRIALALQHYLLTDMGYEIHSLKDLQMNKVEFTARERSILEEASNTIPASIIEEVTVAGTASEAIDKIAKFIDAGVNLILTVPMLRWFKETVEAYGRTIIPYFKESPKS